MGKNVSELSIVTTSDTKPISIILLPDSQFDDWLKAQNKTIQTWVTANSYTGQGFQLIPGDNGQILSCLYGIKDTNSFFIAGDLSNQLPASTYTLDSSLLTLETEQVTEIETNFAISWGLSAYQYNKYKDSKSEKAKLFISNQQIAERAISFIRSITLVRDLINTPASDMMPEHLSDACAQLCSEFEAELSIITGDELLEQNYPTIHAVGRASVNEPRLLDLRWGNSNAPKVTLVGKGVCFDSGGLDLKPSNAMRLMKKDMGGAAHVLGLASLIMSQNLPINLRVLVPAVENAVSSNAFRPGDVITTRSGISVEIDNTDAEGRLVLCDALTEADTEQPDLIIDFATLTGACRVALGTELPGFFCNDQTIANSLIESGLTTDDPVWQLPLHAPYEDMLKSEIADTLNSAPTGFGGAITAALYLQKFVSDNTPWVHFDVMAWNNRKLPGRPVGGEAFGIRAVFELLNQRYNQQ